VCDVADANNYRSVLADLVHSHDHIDILINNAGVDLMLRLPDIEKGDQTVHSVFDVNFFAAVSGTLAVLPAMLRRHHGIIVNMSSDSARAPEPGQGAYAASKAALSAFTESIAHEAAPHGVHVHVLYPGWVPTAMGLSGHEDGGSLPPRPVRRTADRVANLTAERMGGSRIDINAARLPLLAPIAKVMAPRGYQRAMRRMSTT
jgi:NAD(P)-dependent dehydrogenase (short-subunit alcohol dehydrogenase family)